MRNVESNRITWRFHGASLDETMAERALLLEMGFGRGQVDNALRLAPAGATVEQLTELILAMGDVVSAATAAATPCFSSASALSCASHACTR